MMRPPCQRLLLTREVWDSDEEGAGLSAVWQACAPAMPEILGRLSN